jgi:mediator of RNA polymerase II transcription subunit 17
VLKQGFQTASPALQQSVPEASFSFERRQPRKDQKPDAEKERKKLEMWTGSFLTNNTDAADALLAAATRLEGLVKAETEYWGQLLSLTSNGWPVYKPQGANAAMHVRFVASEASPYFKSQGVARLTPNTDGTIKLGRRVGSEPKTLRLRLSRAGEVVSNSVTASLLSLADLGSSLEDKVRKEQNSLFEEELFQEMAMESRILQPLGVKLRNNVLHLPITSAHDSQDEYLIDLIPIDEAAEMVTTDVSEDKDLLDAQSVLLRLLLCHVYHLRLQRRCRIPPPLSETTRREPPSSIIRSFLALTQHHHVCLPLADFISGLNSVLHAAGIQFSCSEVKIPGLHELLEGMTTSSNAVDKSSTLHSLLEQAGRPQKTVMMLKLQGSQQDDASAEHTITIIAYTNLSPPTYGSEFVVEVPQAIAKLIYGPTSHERTVGFSTFTEFKTFFVHLLELHISCYLLGSDSGWARRSDFQPIVAKQRVHNGIACRVGMGVKLDDIQITLVKKWYGGRTDQERKIWTSTSTSDNTFPEVFTTWAKE